jgi:hypothetical protein
MKLCLLAVVIGASLLANSADAQVTTVTTNLSPNADSSVDRLFDWVNKGTAKQLPANGYFKPEGERALFKFDLAQMRSAVSTRSLVRARLVLLPAVPAWSFGTSYVDAFRLTANWSETTVTWKSLFGTSDNFDPAAPTARAVLSDGSMAPVELDVTKDVAAFVAGTLPNYGWVIKDDGFSSGVATEYYSRESATGKPVLIVESTDAPQAGYATLTFPEPGTVQVDSSTGNEIVDVPLHGRTFPNLAAAVSWTAATFNATVQVDGSGAPVGVTGESVQIGDLFYIDSAGNSVEIADIVPVLLGGQDGIVSVAGTSYCVRPEICGEAFKSPPDHQHSCANVTSYCATEDSWLVTPLSRLFIYATVGAEVEQGAGGYHRDCGFCWKGPIPWRCCKSRGSNKLELFNNYLAHEDCHASGCNYYVERFSRTGRNTTSVKDRLFAVFSAKIGLKKGNLSGSPTALPDLPVDGVCSVGNASGVGGSVRMETSAGKTTGVCDYDIPPLQ